MCTPRLQHTPKPGSSPCHPLPGAPLALVNTMGTGLRSCPWEMSLLGWMLHPALPLWCCPPATAAPPAQLGFLPVPPQSSRQVPAASCLIVKAKTIALWLLCSELSPKT